MNETTKFAIALSAFASILVSVVVSAIGQIKLRRRIERLENQRR
jgi:hypothetical protein